METLILREIVLNKEVMFVNTKWPYEIFKKPFM